MRRVFNKIFERKKEAERRIVGFSAGFVRLQIVEKHRIRLSAREGAEYREFRAFDDLFTETATEKWNSC